MSSKIREGWQERLEEYRDLVPHGVELIRMHSTLAITLRFGPAKLSDDELERLTWKLKLVEEEASRMAEAMLKGTLKYESDELTPAEWQAHADEEATDLTCYRLLKRRAEQMEYDAEGFRKDCD